MPALFLALTAVMTWPQLASPYAVGDTGDPLFSIWRLSWVAHQLPRDPLRLFDANIFYPELRTLALLGRDARHGADGCAAPVARRAPGPRLQHRPAAVVRRVRRRDVCARPGADRRPRRGVRGWRGVRLLPVPVRALQPPGTAGDLLDAARAADDAPHDDDDACARRRGDGSPGGSADPVVALLRSVPAGRHGGGVAGDGRAARSADGVSCPGSRRRPFSSCWCSRLPCRTSRTGAARRAAGLGGADLQRDAAELPGGATSATGSTGACSTVRERQRPASFPVSPSSRSRWPEPGRA